MNDCDVKKGDRPLVIFCLVSIISRICHQEFNSNSDNSVRTTCSMISWTDKLLSCLVKTKLVRGLSRADQQQQDELLHEQMPGRQHDQYHCQPLK